MKIGVLTFLIGIAVGVGGTILGPDFIDPYLPEALRAEKMEIEGTVVTKRREGNWVLLMVRTPEGAILITFKQKAVEIDLLAAEGDKLTLKIKQYKPFLEDPVVTRVRKQEPTEQPEGAEPSPPVPSEEGASKTSPTTTETP
ncbi:MAG: hypothetical protein IH857_04050 [Deltaproteobacteria bacterium]|nr:hypothetical protein [Deltaproteobacteria bacterium]MCZ6624663.1 hypothetical protein [Deltaproteobacteria bacterium]